MSRECKPWANSGISFISLLVTSSGFIAEHCGLSYRKSTTIRYDFYIILIADFGQVCGLNGLDVLDRYMTEQSTKGIVPLIILVCLPALTATYCRMGMFRLVFSFAIFVNEANLSKSNSFHPNLNFKLDSSIY